MYQICNHRPVILVFFIHFIDYAQIYQYIIILLDNTKISLPELYNFIQQPNCVIGAESLQGGSFFSPLSSGGATSMDLNKTNKIV